MRITQLIGTTRERFSTGDTYETSDIGTTAALVTAGRDAGIDHIVLLSSAGAGRPVGAYLKAKARVEEMVADSEIPMTVFRPSAFVGEGRRPIPGVDLLTRFPAFRRFRSIAIEDLAAAILHASLERAPLGRALEGEELWRGGERARGRDREGTFDDERLIAGRRNRLPIPDGPRHPGANDARPRWNRESPVSISPT